MPNHIFTIGHSNHTWETFSQLLTSNDVELLVDVRSNPVSRFAPFANYRTLPNLLESASIDYEFMGGSLGGKPSDKAMYDSKGKPDYHKIRSLDEFQDAINQLAGMASRRRTAILCSEEDPSRCHRLLLLEPSLVENGCEQLHIRGSGEIQSTGQLSLGKSYERQLQGTLGIWDSDVKIYTIGFTGKTAAEFFELLNSTDARHLVDTRLNNTSQLAGFTKKRDLEYFTSELTDMSYTEMLMLAPESDMFKQYRNEGNWELYESQYIQLLDKRGVINDLDLGFFGEGVVLLCSERTPDNCHRRLAAEYIKANALSEADILHLQ